MKLHNARLLKTSSKKQQQQQPVTMGLDNTAKAVDHVKIESICSYHIMRVGSNRLSLIHVRLYVSDEIQQLYHNYTSLMGLLRDVQQCKQKCTF